MSQKMMKICDGCGKAQDATYKDTFYKLILDGDHYTDNPAGEMGGSEQIIKKLDFCEQCSREIKETLKKLVNKKGKI